MEKFKLTAEPREETGRTTETLREDGKIPATVYGDGIDGGLSITVGKVEFVKVVTAAGHSGLVDLVIGDKTYPVLIQDYQQHPITDFVTHADFRVVDVTKPIQAVIQLNFVGESRAARSMGGVQLLQLQEVPVMGTPNALVPSIDVDLSKITDFDVVIRVKDLDLPEGLTVDEELLERTIATVTAPRTAMKTAAEEEASEEGGEGEKEEEASK